MKNIDIISEDNETKMADNDFIISKTDAKGVITYCNEIFMTIAGYEEKELVGKNHNVIRHPDVPKFAFKLAWDSIRNGKEFFGFVKNLKKDGGYYWVFANITADYSEHGKIIGYTSVRRKPTQSALDFIIPVYQKMIALEKEGGISLSGKYLLDFLEENNSTYNGLILSLQGE